MLSRLPGPSLGGEADTLYTSLTVPFLRIEHSVTDSGAGRGPMLCFPGRAQLSGPSKLMPFIIRYLTESMHGITASKETEEFLVIGHQSRATCAFVVPAPISLRSGLSQG